MHHDAFWQLRVWSSSYLCRLRGTMRFAWRSTRRSFRLTGPLSDRRRLIKALVFKLERAKKAVCGLLPGKDVLRGNMNMRFESTETLALGIVSTYSISGCYQWWHVPRNAWVTCQAHRQCFSVLIYDGSLEVHLRTMDSGVPQENYQLPSFIRSAGLKCVHKT